MPGIPQSEAADGEEAATGSSQDAPEDCCTLLTGQLEAHRCSSRASTLRCFVCMAAICNMAVILHLLAAVLISDADAIRRVE
jgi:hypothetical protein